MHDRVLENGQQYKDYMAWNGPQGAYHMGMEAKPKYEK